MTNPDLGSWMNDRIAGLRGRSETPLIELSAIAASVLGKSREWIFAHPETTIKQNEFDALENACDRLMNGEPLAYITGKRSFYGLDFMVDARVLIPRPETELLVGLALAWLEKYPDKVQVADIGTGSGAIAITLAQQLPRLCVTAIDLSEGALEIAAANAKFHGVQQRVKFIHNDLLEGMDAKFDLIAANLPYIPAPDLVNLPDLKYEPPGALDGGKDGLRLIERLITTSRKNLAENGCMILEIQYNQGVSVRDMALKYYPRAGVSVHHDLAGLPRVVTIQR